MHQGLRLALLAFLTAEFVGGIGAPACADVVFPDNGQPIADDATVTAVFGGVRYSMSDCAPGSRSVRIDVDQYDPDLPNFLSAAQELSRRAIWQAWTLCPPGQKEEDPYILGAADIYAPNGELAYREDGMTIARDPALPDNVTLYAWQSWHEYYRATMEARKTLYTRLAIAATVILVLAYYLVKHRERIARFYYFNFHPHPAEPIVRMSLRTDSPIDGKALANALAEIPPGNRIFREVRLAQATRLFVAMEDASHRRIAALEKRARDDYQRAAILATQEALALAAVALERARAAFRASQSVYGGA
ncbi:MAG TPA: hypothetical protein VII56_10650 [Rhizomicrobium sp.]